MKVIIGIDPGNTYSGYVIVEHDGKEIKQVLDRGKLHNNQIFDMLKSPQCKEYNLAIEMVESYGMPVGREVFQTCVYIGRFLEVALSSGLAKDIQYIYRHEEKLNLCNTSRAKDSNIVQALVDRFAPGEKNYGKGKKESPGFFYGFAKDAWQAMAVATTYFDKYIK